jgi:hypothetical protein
MARGKVALKKTLTMEDSKRQRFTSREVKRIETIFWATMKRIITSPKDKKDDSDNEIFYTPFQSP